jgi:hypothetical protein
MTIRETRPDERWVDGSNSRIETIVSALNSTRWGDLFRGKIHNSPRQAYSPARRSTPHGMPEIKVESRGRAFRTSRSRTNRSSGAGNGEQPEKRRGLGALNPGEGCGKTSSSRIPLPGRERRRHRGSRQARAEFRDPGQGKTGKNRTGSGPPAGKAPANSAG